MHYRLGRELKALSKIFTLVGILVNVFLLYHYLENEYFLRMKIYYTVVFIFLMILLWVFGKVINGIGVMLTTQGKMLHEPKIEEPEDEESIKSTFLAFCHAFKKNKKAFGFNRSAYALYFLWTIIKYFLFVVYKTKAVANLVAAAYSSNNQSMRLITLIPS